MRRRIKMKITRVQQQTIRLPAAAVRARCPVCEREVETLSAAQAIEVLETDQRGLNCLLAAGQLHAMPTLSGSLRICQASLFAPDAADEGRASVNKLTCSKALRIRKGV